MEFWFRESASFVSDRVLSDQFNEDVEVCEVFHPRLQRVHDGQSVRLHLRGSLQLVHAQVPELTEVVLVLGVRGKEPDAE